MAGIALTAIARAQPRAARTTRPPARRAAAAAASAAAAIDCATGTLDGPGLDRPEERDDEWIKAYQQPVLRTPRSTTRAPAPAPASAAFIGGTADFAGSDSPLKPTTSSPRPTRTLRRQPGDQPADGHRPDRGRLQPRRRRATCSSSRPTLAKIFSGKITKWNDPAIEADNPGATLPSTTITAGAPLGQLRHHRELHQATWQGRRPATGRSATTRSGRPPGGQAREGLRRRCRRGQGTAGAIGYVEWSFAGRTALGTAKINNGAGEYTALTGASRRQDRSRAPRSAGTGDDLKLTIDYATKEAGRLPDRPGDLRDRLQQGHRRPTSCALVKCFLGYTASTDGQAALDKLGYAPPAASRSQTKVADLRSSDRAPDRTASSEASRLCLATSAGSPPADGGGLPTAPPTRRGRALLVPRHLPTRRRLDGPGHHRAIAVFLVVKADPGAFQANTENFFTYQEWFPTRHAEVRHRGAGVRHRPHAGRWRCSMAVPVALGIALFLSHYAPRRVATALGFIIDLLAAVPSVVFGLWGRDYFSARSPTSRPGCTILRLAAALRQRRARTASRSCSARSCWRSWSCRSSRRCPVRCSCRRRGRTRRPRSRSAPPSGR